MAPSENTQNDVHLSSDVPHTKSKPSTTAEPATERAMTGRTNGETDATTETKDIKKSVEQTMEDKLSGAEIKKRAKAEKAARRAQVKQGKPVKATKTEQTKPTTVAAKPGQDIAKAPINGTIGESTPTSKGVHKRTGSMSATSQKAVPLRPTHPQITPMPVQPQKESKNVALFGHLHGHPRRTTLMGTGKDVHPAVLALGLQMSNYVICGSNARCIATLLVFKRVRTNSIWDSV